MRLPGLLVAAALATVLSAPAGAAAAIPATLTAGCVQRDAADDDTASLELPFFFCDDGVPEAGGRDPNLTGEKAITVPAAYGDDGHTGLPPKAPDAAATPGADPAGDVALDVDLSFPDPARFPPPAGGYPVVVFMHGCCSGSKASWESETVDDASSREGWHYSNAWYAARGYVAVTYTSRGFVSGKGPTDPNGDGSTGETLIDHRAFEINDFQSIVAQMADTTFSVGGQSLTIDPQRIVATGGSYGGGFAWLALTDPQWRSPGGRDLRLAAVAPRYGWTDLAYSLVPNGRHLEGTLPAFDGSTTTSPVGFPKRSIVAGLYATGQTGATFPQEITEAFLCLESPLPFAANPQCGSVIDTVLPSFVADRSAYYQNAFFEGLRSGAVAPVPVFSAGALTDPLFPGREHRRMAERLQDAVPGYPIQQYFGDYQHFVQNKRKEWADVCGGRVCALADYPGGDLNAEPAGLTRTGITTRLNRFLDHHVRPQANPSQAAPPSDVTAALQICPSNASERSPVDAPGDTFTAATFTGLAPNTLTFAEQREQRTTSTAVPNTHAVNADPVVQSAARSGACPVDTSPAGPGVATYTSAPLERDATMIGPARVTVPFTGAASELQLNARLYDVAPGGSQTMVDRGFLTLANAGGAAAASPAVFDLLGNAWRFPEGHSIRVELAQDDDPFVRRATIPSSLTLAGVTLEMPVREASATVGPAPAEGAQGGDDDAGTGTGTGKRRADTSRPRRRGDDRRRAAARGSGPDGGSGGGLPFTGYALAAVGALGLVLVAAGLAIRRSAARRGVAAR